MAIAAIFKDELIVGPKSKLVPDLFENGFINETMKSMGWKEEGAGFTRGRLEASFKPVDVNSKNMICEISYPISEVHKSSFFNKRVAVIKQFREKFYQKGYDSSVKVTPVEKKVFKENEKYQAVNIKGYYHSFYLEICFSSQAEMAKTFNLFNCFSGIFLMMSANSWMGRNRYFRSDRKNWLNTEIPERFMMFAREINCEEDYFSCICQNKNRPEQQKGKDIVLPCFGTRLKNIEGQIILEARVFNTENFYTVEKTANLVMSIVDNWRLFILYAYSKSFSFWHDFFYDALELGYQNKTQRDIFNDLVSFMDSFKKVNIDSRKVNPVMTTYNAW